MIVKMSKVYVVARSGDRDRLLDRLGELGAVHLTPVSAEKAIAEEATISQIERLRRAMQILSGIKAGGKKPGCSPLEAAAETLDIQRESAERRSRLTNIHKQVQQLEIWGDVRLEQFEQLRLAGLDARFFTILAVDVGDVQADCVQVIGDLKGKKVLLGAVTRGGAPETPESAEEIELPQSDRPTLRAEAAKIDRAEKAAVQRLAELAHMSESLAAELVRLQSLAQYQIAGHGGLTEESLFAIQGWGPADQAASLGAGLAEAGLQAAVQTTEPSENEAPPTLIRYPRWARPIKGLFDMLGTVAGYEEFDVSGPFMIALPIFAAMLIGDGGYGAILLLAPLIFRKKIVPALGEDFSRLIVVIGAVSLVWGLLCASFFGVTLYKPIIPVDMTDASRNLVMRISFFMGAIHLSFAQIWRGVSFWPSLKSLSSFGWAFFVWGMLGVVKYFVLGEAVGMDTLWPYLLIVGAVLAIVFDSPSKNPAKMLALGLANFPLSMLSAFSDVISYVRLMAVGLASSVLAKSFNELAMSMDSLLMAIPILIFGHGLNLGLAMIALFAHGVRLNMLEFSNNLGMQWTGKPYQPFAQPSSAKEIEI